MKFKREIGSGGYGKYCVIVFTLGQMEFYG